MLEFETTQIVEFAIWAIEIVLSAIRPLPDYGGVAPATISQNSKKFRTLLYFELVGFSSRFWSMDFWNVLQCFELLSIDLFFSFNAWKNPILDWAHRCFCISFETILNRELSFLTFRRCGWFLIVPPLQVSFGSLTFRMVFDSSSEGLSSPSSDVADRSSLRASAVADHVGLWLYLTLRSTLWVVFRLHIGACLLHAVRRCRWSSTYERPPLRRNPSCLSPISVLIDARSLLIHAFY